MASEVLRVRILMNAHLFVDDCIADQYEIVMQCISLRKAKHLLILIMMYKTDKEHL